MRVITGIAKGRKIKAPEGMETRPTSDRVKESVFNIINDKIYEKNILDLFGGTGNLGIECISRGANSCTFVEKNKNTFKILIENIRLLNFENKCKCFNNDAFEVLNLLSKNKMKYDVIFLDPPYGKLLIDKSINKINELELLDENGIIIGEYDEKDLIPEKIGTLHVFRTQRYGRTKVSFWHKEDING